MGPVQSLQRDFNLTHAVPLSTIIFFNHRHGSYFVDWGKSQLWLLTRTGLPNEIQQTGYLQVEMIRRWIRLNAN